MSYTYIYIYIYTYTYIHKCIIMFMPISGGVGSNLERAGAGVASERM